MQRNYARAQRAISLKYARAERTPRRNGRRAPRCRCSPARLCISCRRGYSRGAQAARLCRRRRFCIFRAHPRCCKTGWISTCPCRNSRRFRSETQAFCPRNRCVPRSPGLLHSRRTHAASRISPPFCRAR